jgi:UDP-glucose 4-epimerase
MRRVLITGGAGFIGSHLTDALLAAGDHVTVLDDLSTGSVANLQAAQRSPHFRFVNGTAQQAELLQSLCQQVEEVYHLAAAVGVALVNDQPVESIHRNIEPTRLVLEAVAHRHALGQQIKIFLASSSEVYGRNPLPVWAESDDLVFGPTTKSRWSYGMSKAIDECLALGWAKTSGLPIVIGRFFNVVGPRQTGTYGMVMPRFISAALQHEPLEIYGDGSQTRCFAHVYDVIAAVMGLMRCPSLAAPIYNIGSDEPISMLALAQRVIARTQSSSKLVFRDYASVFDADFEDVAHRVPSLQRLKGQLAWRLQYSLDEIIADIARAEQPQP